MKFFYVPGKALAILITLSAFYSTSEANVSILDNGEPGASSSGSWRVSRGANPYGGNSLFSSKAGATYTYSVKLPKPGEYKVFARWTKWGNRRTSVPYDINHVGGATTVTVNQKKKSGQWNQLGGTWFFNTRTAVTLRSLGNGTTSADAIKFVPVTNSSGTGSGKKTGSKGSNAPPTVRGTSTTQIVTNNYYYFKPVASDTDNDQLTFNIINRPSWAYFNKRTGELAGTPFQPNDVGITPSIKISVSDGNSTVSLPPFSLAISGTRTGGKTQKTGSVNLSWTAPVARVDGKAISMSEIAGYTVYYGTSRDKYPKSRTINNAYDTSVAISNLLVGTYYLVVTTRDTNGRESRYSSTVTKQVQ